MLRYRATFHTRTPQYLPLPLARSARDRYGTSGNFGPGSSENR